MVEVCGDGERSSGSDFVSGLGRRRRDGQRRLMSVIGLGWSRLLVKVLRAIMGVLCLKT